MEQLREQHLESEEVDDWRLVHLEAQDSPSLVPLLTTETSTALTDRCNICSQNLQICITAIRHATSNHRNIFEKLRLEALQNRLIEHRIRFDIWRSDCEVLKGWLSGIEDGQETGLYKLVDGSFIQLNQSFVVILDCIRRIARHNAGMNGGSSNDR